MPKKTLSAATELLETQTRIKEIMAALPCILYKGTIFKNGKIRLEHISPSTKDILGVPADTILKDSGAFYNSIAPEDRAWIFANHKKLLTQKIPAVLDKDVKLMNGKWTRFCAYPKKDTEGNICWNGIIFDISDRKNAEDRLTFLAYHDPLTEVGNRELLFKEFGDIIATAGKNRKNVAVVSLSPDGLGQINATAGLAVGDKVLTKFARRIEGFLDTKDDLFVRMAGHRFIIVLGNLSSHVSANKKISKILKAFTKPIKVGLQEFELSVTMGVSFYPVNGKTAEVLISHADAALDFAKQKNRGTAALFSEELAVTLSRNMKIRRELRCALEKGDIIPYFQPQVDVKTGAIIGVEALARWKTTDSLLSPNEFIPIAEEYGLIAPLTWQILKASCIYAKRWHDKGYGPIPVAVNISGDLFRRSGVLVKSVRSILNETGLHPSLLELELTESAAMLDPAVAIAVLNDLEADGVTCSIDDFGTGYSSLSVLKTFPLKKLKIDRSFVMDLNIDQSDTAIVKATIAVGKALNLSILAEGVETKYHFDVLRQMGCDAVQGYLFSCPVSADEMEEMIKSWDAKKVLADLR